MDVQDLQDNSENRNPESRWFAKPILYILYIDVKLSERVEMNNRQTVNEI